MIRSPLALLGPLFLIICPTSSVAQLPNGLCAAKDVACELEDDNVIDIVGGVSDVEECRQTCIGNSSGCEFYSHFGGGGFPFRDTCMLFNECNVLGQCEDCYSEDVRCDVEVYCSAPVEGLLGNNLIGFVNDVTEAACEAECTVEEECLFFTYHWPNSTLYPSTCFLLTEILDPITPCEGGTCASGSPNCGESLCGFVDGSGTLSPSSLMLTVPGVTEVAMLRIGACPEAVVVAIGGGGSSGGGGAGSGYIDSLQFSDYLPYAQFETKVGVGGQDSYVRFLSNGTDMVKAEAGLNSGTYDGTDGYSGGGGVGIGSSPCGDGGTDGGDGQRSDQAPGGKGSGIDVSTIPLKSFTLRPGEGGYGYAEAGGGGGVFINNEGPDDGVYGSRGEGYGGGGGGYDRGGSDGAIMFDFI